MWLALGSIAAAVELDVVCWGQGDSRWSHQYLDGSSCTMGRYGCAVTSCAMVAHYFGSEKDPGRLCRALGTNGGLDANGLIYWERVPNAAGGTITYVGRWDYPYGADLGRINTELDSGHPVVAEVRRNGGMHFVVLTGREGSIYYINDPASGERTSVNNCYGSPSSAIRGIRVYHGQHEELGADWRFTDVSPEHPYRVAIEELADRKIVSGYLQSSGTARFYPDRPVLRAQFAKLVCRSFALPVDETVVTTFVDMGPDNPADLYPHDYVGAAAASGIIRGRNDLLFDPWTDIRRAQVVTMLVRAAEVVFPCVLVAASPEFACTLPPFEPAHDENLRIAEFNGLLAGLVGYAAGWDPWAPCTRGEASLLLFNWLALLERQTETATDESPPAE